ELNRSNSSKREAKREEQKQRKNTFMTQSLVLGSLGVQPQYLVISQRQKSINSFVLNTLLIENYVLFNSYKK
ncbi:MAG: hypothetical protein P8P35_18030, partial [Planktotalea sp.]|uniref:hypothetical protein n=1 Tax=Planktotalea sp. TaxID=2029877 RepID=UPI00263431B8